MCLLEWTRLACNVKNTATLSVRNCKINAFIYTKELKKKIIMKIVICPYRKAHNQCCHGL